MTEHAAGDRRVEHGLACGHPAHRGDDVGGRRVFEQGPGGTDPHRLEHMVVCIEGRQDHDLRRVGLPAQLRHSLQLTGTAVTWTLSPALPLQLLAVLVAYLVAGAGFGLLFQNTPLAVVAYLLLPSILAPVAVLVPGLLELAPWIALTAGTTSLLSDDVAGAVQWAQVLSVTAIWAGVPFALGWLRLHRRDIA